MKLNLIDFIYNKNTFYLTFSFICYYILKYYIKQITHPLNNININVIKNNEPLDEIENVIEETKQLENSIEKIENIIEETKQLENSIDEIENIIEEIEQIENIIEENELNIIEENLENNIIIDETQILNLLTKKEELYELYTKLNNIEYNIDEIKEKIENEFTT